ncbi:MAG: GC-type dockerin domain-anchored protein [Planctomycetota bacterium]
MFNELSVALDGRGWHGFGRFKGHGHGWFVLSSVDGSVRGIIHDSGETTKLSMPVASFESGSMRAKLGPERDDMSASRCGVCDDPNHEHRMDDALHPVKNTVGFVESGGVTASSSTPAMIDLFIAYNAGYRVEAGGATADAEAALLTLVAALNMSLANSLIDNVRWSLVYSYETFVEPCGMPFANVADYDSSSPDRVLPEIGHLRDELQADVFLSIDFCPFLTPNAAGGFADVGSVNTPNQWIASIQSSQGLIGSTFEAGAAGHELGHVLGILHNTDAAAATQFRNAYAFPDGSAGTLVSRQIQKRLLYYSNPNVLDPDTMQPLGIPIGQPNDADAAEWIRRHGPNRANYRTGVPSITDVDMDGTPDLVEIGNGAVDCNDNFIPDFIEFSDPSLAGWHPQFAPVDCNNNGVHDGCDAQTTSFDDCNDNFKLDSCETIPGVTVQLELTNKVSPSVPQGRLPNGDLQLDPLVQIASGLDEPVTDVTFTIEYLWSYFETDPLQPYQLELILDGVNQGIVITSPANCVVTSVPVVVPLANAATAFADGEITVELRPLGIGIANTLCGMNTAYTVITASYDRFTGDGNSDGVPDSCQPCDFVDITTTGTNAGDPGFGEPDGVIDLSDYGYFLNLWGVDDPGADITFPGSCSPLQPDGLVGLEDFSCFLSLYSLCTS